MKINNKIMMHSLPMVAAVLGKQYGVEVEVGGKDAYTDGKVIHLPGVDLESTPELMNLVRGYLDHESAHIRYTKFDVLKNSNLSPLTKQIFNIIEDWRVENALTKSFPGCRGNFSWLIQHHFGEPTKVSNKPEEIVNYILYAVRSWDVSDVEPNRDHVADALEIIYPGLVSQLNMVLDLTRKDCDSTFSAIYYAERLVEIIKLEAKRQTKKQPKDHLQESSTGPRENIDADDKKACRSGKKLEKLLTDGSKSLLSDLGKLSENELSDEFEQHGSYNNTVAVVGSKKLESLSACELSDVKRSSVALETKLQALLQASVMKRKRPARRGRLDPSKLYKMRTDPRLFLRNEQSTGINTSIHVLLDCSGSMRRRITLATQACYSMAHSLNKINGVSVAVTAFPAEAGDSKAALNGICPAVYPILKHGEKLHGNFKMKATGTTPMGESIWWVMQNDLRLKEDRKIIFIITDGRPDSDENTEQAIFQGKELGYEFYAIGINETYIEKILPDNSRVITKLDELSPVMFELLQNALLTKSH